MIFKSIYCPLMPTPPPVVARQVEIVESIVAAGNAAGYGFAAIIVAFVGRLHPVGMIFSAILMSMFYIGGELAQSRLGLPKSLTGVFQGLLLFTLLACDTLIAYRIRFQIASARG